MSRLLVVKGKAFGVDKIVRVNEELRLGWTPKSVGLGQNDSKMPYFASLWTLGFYIETSCNTFIV